MEQELDSNTINKYVDSLHKLSIITGKLDAVLLYLQKTQNEDKFLSQSLDSVLKDVLNINGDKEYIPMILGSHKIVCEVKPKIELQSIPNGQDGQLTTKEVQIPQKKINKPLKLNVVTDNSIIDYPFENSANLGHFYYKGPVLRVTYKNNGRVYNYPSVPRYKVEKTIELDKLNMHPGKYFNAEIKNNYGYAEVTGCHEKVG